MIGRFLFLVLLCAGVAAFAHQDDPVAGHAGFDCEHPPQDAVTTLPGVLGEAGQIMCMPTGQRIVASPEWTWRYTGSFFNVPNVPSFAHSDSQLETPPFYFKKVSAEELNGEEADRRSAALAQQIETYRPGNSISSMTIVKAENNYGHITEIVMPMKSRNDGWAIVCAPQCQPDYVIIIRKREPN